MVLRPSLENESDATQALSNIANAIGGLYYAIYHIWLSDHTFVCFDGGRSGLACDMDQRKNYDASWSTYIDKHVNPEDRASVREFCDLEKLKERLTSTDSATLDYRRINHGWTRASYLVAQRDSQGVPTCLVFTANDINAERIRTERVEQVMYESNHDALTGALNRKAFDEALKQHLFEGVSTGFVLLDVDNFKNFNDEHGHEMGDKVLTYVARELKNAFRSEDKVFRIGGDEFGVLLHDCSQDSWDVLCRKFRHIHLELRDVLSEDLSVTFSAGTCFSDSGLRDWMYSAADEGLYNTKKNGRAGCTMVDHEGQPIAFWSDDELSVETKTALASSNAGLCRIEIPHDRTQPSRMICGEMLHGLLGVSLDATAEECYACWERGIDQSYREVVREGIAKMLNGQIVECTYSWHRKDGDAFSIQATGSGEVNDDMSVICGIFRSLKGSIVVEREDESKLLADALTKVYFSSIYINIEHDEFITVAAPDFMAAAPQLNMPASVAFEYVTKTFVAPEYQQKIREFVDLSTLSERMEGEDHLDCECYTSGPMGWCRANWFPIKRADDGRVLAAFFAIDSIDSIKQAEIEQEKAISRLMSLHYEAAETVLDSRILAIALIDKRTGEGDSWTSNTNYSVAEPLDYQALINRGSLHVTESDRERFLYSLDLETVFAALRKQDSYMVPAELHFEDKGRWQLEYHFATYEKDNNYVLEVIEDVSDRAEVEHDLKKAMHSLRAALGASDQVCFEYDPTTHVAICYNEVNFFGLPQRIDVSSETLAAFDLIHPDDFHLFDEAVHKMENGAQSAYCDVRIKRDGEYRWFGCSFDERYDEYLGRSSVLLRILDITVRVSAYKAFEDRIASLLSTNEDSLCVGIFNITRDEVIELRVQDKDFAFVEGVRSYSDMLNCTAEGVLGDAPREVYRKTFAVENLRRAATQGKTKVHLDGLHQIALHRIEWVEATVELVPNPISGDIEGIGYVRSVNMLRMGSLLINRGLRTDYPMAAVLVNGGDEYYLFDASSNEMCTHHQDFWTDNAGQIRKLCAPDVADSIHESLSKEKVLARLKLGEEPSFTFDAHIEGKLCRLALRFSILDVKRGLLLAALRDITDEQMLNRLRHDARHDGLTDLYNRKTVFELCRNLLDEYPDEQFVMVHLNVRRFRLFNSFFGEEAGDKLLCSIADGLRNLMSDYDYCAYGRIEGDNFCAFVPKRDELLEKHIEVMTREFGSYTDSFTLEPSVGIYDITNPSLSIESMFARAATAAKEGGTRIVNQVYRYDEAMERALAEELTIANEMQYALDQGQFAVYLQPKYDLQTGNHAGAEALVRWINPERGVVSPAKFIPVFETNGFISSLDRYMWEKVCRLLRKWKDEGCEVNPISVNVSRVSAYNPTTVAFLKDLVSRYDLSPELLELELTETAYIDDPTEMKLSLGELQDFGFKILMDDFGSGYSSLNTLRELPVDCLKLDMRFLSESCDDERGRTMLSSMINMTKRLALPVVAEGVETEVQAEYLKSLGCEYVQGYLFAKPMPVEEYEILLHS